MASGSTFAHLPKDVAWVTDFLRSHVAHHDAVSLDKRVLVSKGSDLIATLLSDAYKTASEPLQQKAAAATSRLGAVAAASSSACLAPPLLHAQANASDSLTPPPRDRAVLMLQTLLEHGVLMRAKLIKKRAVPQSQMAQALARAEAAQGGSAKPTPPKEEDFIFEVEPNHVNLWDDASLYIWIYEGSKLRMYLYSFALLVVTLSGVMYPLWPYNLRLVVYYLSMVAVGLLGLLMLTAVIRLIMYVCSTLVCSQGFWLFPNLFEDCGFFESFVPLYAWEAAGTVALKED